MTRIFHKRTAKQLMDALLSCKRPRGRPRIRWLKTWSGLVLEIYLQNFFSLQQIKMFRDFNLIKNLSIERRNVKSSKSNSQHQKFQNTWQKLQKQNVQKLIIAQKTEKFSKKKRFCIKNLGR